MTALAAAVADVEAAPGGRLSVPLLVLVAVMVAQGLLVAPAERWLRRRDSSLARTLVPFAGFALLALALDGAWRLLQLDLEQHAAAFWVVVAIGSAGVGTGVAWRWRRVPGAELVIAALLITEVAAARILAFGENVGLADPAVRALLVAPAAIALLSYFGASFAYLVWGEGERGELAFGYELAVGSRFLLSKASAALSTVTAISMIGVTLGVAVVIVALAVLAGFEHDLERKIIGANAHVIVQRHGGHTFDLPEGVLPAIDAIDGVVASSPFLQGEVAVASSTNYTGALLFGIDGVRAPRVLSVLAEHVVGGDLAGLAGADAPNVAPTVSGIPNGVPPPSPVPTLVAGVEMQKSLGLRPDNRVTILSPLLETLTPLGPVPASRPFRVGAVFESGMYEYDARFAFVSLAAARRFFQVGPETISGVQVRVEDPARADRVGAAIVAKLGGAPCGDDTARSDCGWEALDWQSRNRTLFAALKLEKVVAFIVLVFIILVASFSIVNTLTMSIIEKQKEIAILKTMGARDVGVMKIFLIQGTIVGLFGTLLGSAFGVGIVGYLYTFGLSIPSDVYYISSLPVHLEAQDVVLVVLAALLILWDFAVFPALRGSRLRPVEGLRDA